MAANATSEHYRGQAERCEADAAASDLTEVRDRNLRSAAAWHAMASRQQKSEAARAEKDRLAEAVRKQCLA
ncbi:MULTISPECIES: hypothetical protein [unclassified Sphingopyxis]|uniref:hypothetical protein n=1 Tax=unclassified Sphingopyxis TaxID=2614943 RepID=UPI000736D1FF|nr:MULTISPECIES: hypothetical protein [unclassified Sphingopyxis]KTE42369.1 hypothetical protein ATE62_04925 [Sphingopyxis sp. HIX]KTE85376.1 hypothetical protein ATE72_03790 [Sphingopyxis sp. HXXIV]